MFFTIIPLLLFLLIFVIAILPDYPLKVSEIENCYPATVKEKFVEEKNDIRKYYHGKRYYYITAIDGSGEEQYRIRVLKKVYDKVKEGDKVICFDYKRSTLMLGSRAAILDLN